MPIEPEYLAGVGDLFFASRVGFFTFLVGAFRGFRAFGCCGFVILGAHDEEFVEGTTVGVVGAGVERVGHSLRISLRVVASAARRRNGLRGSELCCEVRVARCDVSGTRPA